MNKTVSQTPARWGRQVLWMAGIWAGSVLALGAVALAVRVAMSLAGMQS